METDLLTSLSAAVVPYQYDCNGNLLVSKKDLQVVKNNCLNSSTRRSRICAHSSPEKPIHEMLIAFHINSYIRPHRHKNKIESFHIIEGELDIIFFEENGSIKQRISLGEYSSGKNFYLRCENHCWHTVLIKSQYALIHETTSGPFDPNETEYASWAPDSSSQEEVVEFLKRIAS
jgi:cupin fold WbuC family metalloprotein